MENIEYEFDIEIRRLPFNIKKVIWPPQFFPLWDWKDAGVVMFDIIDDDIYGDYSENELAEMRRRFLRTFLYE